MKNRIIVGSQEWCAFPELGVPAIKARVDSGARTSAIHSHHVRSFKRGQKTWVRFEIHPLQHNRMTVLRCEAEVIDRRAVKSSSGHTEKRYVIVTPLQIGGQVFVVELTLANRDSMGYRMLLGREAMQGRMLVDPEGSFLTGVVAEQELDRLYGRGRITPGGLKIGLLAANPEEYSSRRLLEAGRKRGHQMHVLPIQSCSLQLGPAAPAMQSRGATFSDRLDALIPWFGSEWTTGGCALLRYFEGLNTVVLNSAASIRQSRDPVSCLQGLLRSGLGIPTTGFGWSPTAAAALVDKLGGAPLILRAIKESRLLASVRAETRAAAEAAIQAMQSLDANVLIQEFIAEAQSTDLRCLVINGRVVACVERQVADRAHQTGPDATTLTSGVRPSAQEKKLAVRAVRAIGLVVARVDLIRSHRGPLILDVSAAPDLDDLEKTTGKDLAQTIIKAVEQRLNWQTPAEQSRLVHSP
ncbi:MAG: RimK family alpha-L-glutamate ligase [Leptospiraceae bacterium]|nr:RimK family alpha-L-glutamate ligase [Leptospiraceae bacterium]